MAITRERLQAALTVAIRLVRERDDGRKLVPLVVRIEQEIAAIQSSDDAYARIMRDV